MLRADKTVIETRSVRRLSGKSDTDLFDNDPTCEWNFENYVVSVSKAFTRESDNAGADEIPSIRPRPSGAKNYITREGAERLRKRLVDLREERRNLTDQKQDPNANSALKRLELECQKLQSVLESAIIADPPADQDKIALGAWVTLRDEGGAAALSVSRAVTYSPRAGKSWSISIKAVATSSSLVDSGLFGFWRRFGSVTGFFKPAPSPKPRQNPKILAAHRYIFSVNALIAVFTK